MTPEQRAAVQNAELDLAEAELSVRDDVRATAARRLYAAAADLDVPAAARATHYLAPLVAELDAVGDAEVAQAIDAAARYVGAVQASAYGLARLAEIGLTLHDC